MDADSLNPALERLWIDEVRYLHSLWHQGPPRNPNPSRATLRPLNSTIFKKKTKNSKSRHFQRQQSASGANLDPLSDCLKTALSGIEWPCDPLPSQASQPEIGWGSRTTQPAVPQTYPASQEEIARFSAVQLQKKGLKSCQDFFYANDSSDDDDDDEEEVMDIEESEPGSISGVPAREDEAFKFFLGLFTGDEDLRKYYEKNRDRGEFCCLVCGVIGGILNKRFGDCVALVQHSISVLKKKKKWAHRGFGRAVCRVLGWDINRLPSIVLAADEPLSHFLVNSNSQLGSKENGATNDKKEDVHN